MRKKPALTVVGTGYAVAGQVSVETVRAIEMADKVFYLMSDPISAKWLESLNPTAESLGNSYQAGRRGVEIYEEVVARILKPLRDGRNVCAAYYGHPGILCVSAHEAVQRARQLGFSARMLPAVSAMDSLFADLEIDPCFGLYSYDATDFVFKRRPYDPRYMLILWQIGLVGVHSHQPKDLWSRSGVRRLTETLMETYSADHEVVLYEIQYRPAPEPVIERMPLARLPHAAVTIASLLYVPPK